MKALSPSSDMRSNRANSAPGVSRHANPSPTITGQHYVRGATYANVVHSLDRWPVALFYIVANVALGFHLYHGVWSLFQSLGWNNPRFNRWRRGIAVGFTVIVCGANISFPIMVLAGVVGHLPAGV